MAACPAAQPNRGKVVLQIPIHLQRKGLIRAALLDSMWSVPAADGETAPQGSASATLGRHSARRATQAGVQKQWGPE